MGWPSSLLKIANTKLVWPQASKVGHFRLAHVLADSKITACSKIAWFVGFYQTLLWSFRLNRFNCRSGLWCEPTWWGCWLRFFFQFNHRSSSLFFSMDQIYMDLTPIATSPMWPPMHGPWDIQSGSVPDQLLKTNSTTVMRLVLGRSRHESYRKHIYVSSVFFPRRTSCN